jgi:hypothetical protein
MSDFRPAKQYQIIMREFKGECEYNVQFRNVGSYDWEYFSHSVVKRDRVFIRVTTYNTQEEAEEAIQKDREVDRLWNEDEMTRRTTIIPVED